MTRIGIGADTPSRADAPALRRIAEGVRLDLSQAASMDGAAATIASQRQARKLKSFLLATHQPPSTGQRRLSESCVAILAAKEGYLDSLVDGSEPEQARKTFQDLLDHVSNECPIEMNEIDSSLDISEEAKATLDACIRAFFT
jgi:F0F1-type ATP synthase alpha subunit